MKFTGDATLNAPVDKVWDALLDPSVLVRTIPGCERLEATGENAYAMTVTAGVAAIKGTYSGSCKLSDLQPHQSLVMKLQGAGAPGTIGADVERRVRRRRGRQDHDHLRRGRGRGRHGRGRGAADADLASPAGWRGSSSATSTPRSRASWWAPLPGRMGLLPLRGLVPQGPPRPSRASSSLRRRPPPASARRTTSSRASRSAPGWSCSASSSDRCSVGAPDGDG